MGQKSAIALASALLIGAVIALAAPAASAQSLRTFSPQDYRSNGTLISGWNWLRSQGDYAEWTWTEMPAPRTEACVNFSVLVTNGANGGSGHSGAIRIAVIDARGGSTGATVRLDNPFRPRVDTNTNGVGYQAYGALCSTNIVRLLEPGARLRMEWSTSAGVHVAVRKEGAVVAYSW